jgi:lipopolysaccharide/colanic/teichoic acid biosynthesis glycosyltransferase
MNRRRELWTLIIGDFIAINGAWMLYYWMRVNSGWFITDPASDISSRYLFTVSLFFYGFWMMVFLFFGLYRSWYVRAPFDEVVTLLKTLTIGVVFLGVAVFWDPVSNVYTHEHNDPRLLTLMYWVIIASFVIGFRSIIRFGQRRLLEAGVGRRTSIIIGDPVKARDLAARIEHFPRLGYEVIGFVTPPAAIDLQLHAQGLHQASSLTSDLHTSHPSTMPPKVLHKDIPKLGTTEELERIIDEHDVKEVLIALGSNEHEAIIDVVARASKSNAGLKIEPGLYDIISGQARAREIYGFPLIDINPVLLRPWEEAAKRTLDIVLSTLVLIIGLPIWLFVAMLVKVTSKGPAIYSQERIGRDGKPYRIYKFRSMRTDAEVAGPQWASKNDPRVTPLGRFLRKSHLDEVPQFWNVLIGDMSLVGPRPEREFFVKKLIEEIPYYNRRHKVRPGITGLYQAMIDKYDEDLDDVRMRVKYDLMYLESMSFRMDVKILVRTAYMMLKGRGQA